MSRIFEALKQSGAANMVEESAAAENAAELIETADSRSLDKCAEFAVVSSPQARLVSISDEHGFAAEKIRVLATKLRHMAARRPLKTLLVTSSMKGDGKSVVAANLAITLAKHSRLKVLLIDGDFRQPTLASKFGCTLQKTLADWWREPMPMQQLLYKEKELPLWFLPAGQFENQPLEVLQSEKLAELMKQLTEMFDWVVIDSPPMVPLADSRVWANFADGVMMVVRERYTQVDPLNRAVEAIEAKKFLGVVMNDTNISESKYYPSYYQYAVNKEEPRA
jgi:protein-tyrosine kinase